MLTDPISDMLTRVRNALMMRHAQVPVPYSRLKEAVVKILKQEGFIHGYEVLGEKTKKMLVIELKYASDGKSVITTLRKISKPGRRFFAGYENFKSYREGMGLKILTTSKGILSDHEALKQKVGGEILIEVW